jgi:protein O-GlcNAc transferase
MSLKRANRSPTRRHRSRKPQHERAAAHSVDGAPVAALCDTGTSPAATANAGAELSGPTSAPTGAAGLTIAEGLAAHRAGRLLEAETIYSGVLRSNPGHFDALHMLGVVCLQTGRTERGVDLIRNAIALNASAEAHNHLGNGLRALQLFDEALSSYDAAIGLRPAYADAYYNRGVVLRQLQRSEQALASFDRAIALRPDDVKALASRADVLHACHRFMEALADTDRLITLMPGPENHIRRANILIGLQRFEEALASYDHAIVLEPEAASAHCNRGVALFNLGRFAAALASYDRSIELKPLQAEAFNNRGNALVELARNEEAIASYDRAIAIRPDYFDALLNRGNLLRRMAWPERALVSYDAALQLNSAHAGAHNNRGIALWDLKRPTEALESYRRSIELDPAQAEAYNNRGALLLDLNRYAEALADFDCALERKPDYHEAQRNRGNAFARMRDFEKAFTAYDELMAIVPDMAGVEGLRLDAKMQNCDWCDIEREADHLVQAVRNGTAITQPFSFLAVPSTTARDQLRCSQSWTAEYFPPLRENSRQALQNSRIHVAYLSADFRHHPMAHLMAGLFECHDRAKFRISGISLGADELSDIRNRLKSGFEDFIDADSLGDQEIADLVQSRRVDILVDLMGFTSSARTGILSRRPAPIQVNYLGYPGTMGAPYIDYIVADRIVIPQHQHADYREKIVYMPYSYQVSDAKRPIAEIVFSRDQLRLPRGAFVFCCFNKAYKINPETFDGWMRILNRVPGSVLWLADNGPTAASNLRKEAAKRRVEPARLVFAPLMPMAQHLARHRAADLGLDTLPYNAHTTASDALWAGLPMITLIGETFAGRVAASLLHALEMPDLVCSTPRQYEDLAVELALHPDRLTNTRLRLAANRLTTPLFDTAGFTRDLEAAFSQMVARHAAGLGPSDFAVTARRPEILIPAPLGAER